MVCQSCMQPWPGMLARIPFPYNGASQSLPKLVPETPGASCLCPPVAEPLRRRQESGRRPGIRGTQSEGLTPLCLATHQPSYLPAVPPQPDHHRLSPNSGQGSSVPFNTPAATLQPIWGNHAAIGERTRRSPSEVSVAPLLVIYRPFGPGLPAFSRRPPLVEV